MGKEQTVPPPVSESLESPYGVEELLLYERDVTPNSFISACIKFFDAVGVVNCVDCIWNPLFAACAQACAENCAELCVACCAEGCAGCS